MKLIYFIQLNEAELEVDSEKASYKQKLEVLQQQQELIEDEEEQEQKEEDARRAKREADELEARTAQSLLPDSEVRLTRVTRVNMSNCILQLLPDKLEDENARMTTEQLKELGEALSILSAKSSVLQERDELRSLMEENLSAEEVRCILHSCCIIHLIMFCLGSQVALRRTDEAYPHYADQNRHATPGIRQPCWKLLADDLC